MAIQGGMYADECYDCAIRQPYVHSGTDVILSEKTELEGAQGSPRAGLPPVQTSPTQPSALSQINPSTIFVLVIAIVVLVFAFK
jgi:hypothetical protein